MIGTNNNDKLEKLDSLYWALSENPVIHGINLGLFVVEAAMTRKSLVDMYSAVSLGSYPRFRQRIAPASLKSKSPRWEEDPEFDINDHLEWEISERGSVEDVAFSRASELMTEPYDRSKPLWAVTAISHRPSAKTILIWRMHHSISDTVRSGAAFPSIFNLGPGMPDLDQFIKEHNLPDAKKVYGLHGQSGEVKPKRNIAKVLKNSLSTMSDYRVAAEALANPPGLLFTPTEERSPDRYLDRVSVNLEQLKAASKHYECKLNDIFLIILSSAYARYYEKNGGLSQEVRVCMPVNIPGNTAQVGNHHTEAFIEMPIIKSDHRQARDIIVPLSLDSRTLALSKPSQVIADLSTKYLPLNYLVKSAVSRNLSTDVIASSIIGSPLNFYMKDDKIESMTFFTCLFGAPVSIAMYSYAGVAHFGIGLDKKVIHDPDFFKSCLLNAVSSVLELID